MEEKEKIKSEYNTRKMSPNHKGKWQEKEKV